MKRKELLLGMIVFLFFIIIEINLRQIALSLNSSPIGLFSISFMMFTIFYILLFLFILYFLSKKESLYFAGLIETIYLIIFVTNYFLLNIKKVPLSLSLMPYVEEAVDYSNFIIKEINLYFIMMIGLLILFEIVSLKLLSKIKEKKKRNQKKAFVIGIMILSILLIASELSLNLKIYKKSPFNGNYYHNNHIVMPNSLLTLGLTEYMVRDVVLTAKSFFYSDSENIKETIKEQQEMYHIDKEENDYTGIFKDKNLIMIMLESMDNYIINEENTPTLVKLRKEGLDFTERYSYLPVGGSTIRAEYSSMTGLYFKEDYLNSILKKDYDQSLPNMFRKNGYTTQSMHENVGSYYNRNILHKNYHFDNSYFLMDISDDVIPYTDAQMVDNDEFYHKIVPKNTKKFMSYIVTISAHGPYNEANEECKGIGNDTECFKKLAKRTDVFLDHLLKRLKEDQLLDDTVILLYTDHQSYAYDYEESYLKKLKTIDNKHHIKSIPFIIYQKNIEPKTFDNILVNDIDILPTILNLFDIDYNPNEYLGVDIFSKDHRNLLMFNDLTWYDGKNYSLNLSNKEYQKYKDNDSYLLYKFRLNDMILKEK